MYYVSGAMELIDAFVEAINSVRVSYNGPNQLSNPNAPTRGGARPDSDDRGGTAGACRRTYHALRGPAAHNGAGAAGELVSRLEA
ncbi:hypothetical protein ACSX1A_13275 [Pontibacter sp. MBLB2868]|uniref:hypothetical protein n=1 Tax=Pontibacter sp. MBLB2868 TaxID=3451555 RepID=UPI003F74F359